MRVKMSGTNYQENLAISRDSGCLTAEAPLHIKGLFLVSVPTSWLDRTRPWKLYLELPGPHFPRFFQGKHLADSEDCVEYMTTEMSVWGMHQGIIQSSVDIQTESHTSSNTF